jgi:hypothetical protein
VLEWEPEISLEDGLAKTYAWIEAQVAARLNAVNLANTVGVANAQLL